MNNINQAIASANRFSRAKQIIAEGYTFSQDADTGAIAVCKPGKLAASYWINLLSEGCDCPDRLKGNKCKHEFAWDILQSEKEDEEKMWESICAEHDRREEMEGGEGTHTLTVGMVLESLQARIVQDMDRAEAHMLKRDIQPPAVKYDRHRRFQNLQGALDVIGSYQTKEECGLLDLTQSGYVSSVATEDIRF